MRAIDQASSEPAAKLAKGAVRIEAEPYEFMLLPEHCALLIIDMQRDFLEPGGFGEMLGNDVSQLRRTHRAEPQAAGGVARRRTSRVSIPGRAIGPTSLICRRPRKSAAAAQRSDRRRRPDGPHSGARRGRPRHHSRALSRARRAGHRQARQGRVLRDRPARDPAAPERQAARRHRRDDGGLRQHDGARGQRPRLRLPRARGLLRLLLSRSSTPWA